MEILGRRRENREPLSRWGERARTVCRFFATLWGLLLVLGFAYRLVVIVLPGRGPVFPNGDGGTSTADLVFLVTIVVPVAVSGLVWLAAEAVRGYRESDD